MSARERSNLPPPPPLEPLASYIDGMEDGASLDGNSEKRKYTQGYWSRITNRAGGGPCPRSLHAGAVWRENLYVFGGYDGQQRCNDLHAFNFRTNTWTLIDTPVITPSRRDRHVAVVHDNYFYVFAGFDGRARVNDIHVFDLERGFWEEVEVLAGSLPSPRHSHSAVIYGNSMYMFGGYDGSYCGDFHEFNFLTRTWSQIPLIGEVPHPRYRGTCVVHGDTMILHGGHDGNRHLNDTFIFNFTSRTWSSVSTEGMPPSPRDSQTAVAHQGSMFIFGGSTGGALGDFHELNLESFIWSPVVSFMPAGSTTSSNYHKLPGVPDSLASASASGSAGSGSLLALPSSPTRTTAANAGSGSSSSIAAATVRTQATRGPLASSSSINNSTVDIVPVPSPGSRFCHIAVMYDGCMFMFGGYDGFHRLNDFLKYTFVVDQPEPEIPPSTLVSDLKGFVNSDLHSDITFLVDGIHVRAHKILCMRCPYFQNMLTGEYMESRASEVVIEDVRHDTFLLLLEYLYSDSVKVTVDTAMDLFQVADRFGVERLKKICECALFVTISVDTVAQILLAADHFNAQGLREKCMSFILTNFDEVTKTSSFEEMGRNNVDLVFEILKMR